MKSRFGLVGALLLAACGGDDAPEVDAEDLIAGDVFVQTYVELRMESFDNTPRIITTGERDRILQAHDVSEEELRLFLEVHGPDVEYMRDLWAEIEAQILSLLSPAEDSLGGDPPLPDDGAN